MTAVPQKAFCDSSFLIAVYCPFDKYHNKADSILRTALKAETKLYVSWFIIAETQIVLRKKAGHNITLRFLDNVRGGAYEIISDIEESLLFEAVDVIRKYSKDYKLSLCDAISTIIIAKKLGNIPCYSFDWHFKKLGVKTIP